jgi:hypothetical protein
MDTDKKIITQVAAKIAADLVNKEADTEAKLGEFVVLFESIRGIMFDVVDAGQPKADIYQMVQTSFNATPVETSSSPSTTTTGPLQIVGTQHGDIPDWLIKACKRDGVTKVYDNRDGLAVNAKRPWFRAVEGEKAYWAPRTRS